MSTAFDYWREYSSSKDRGHDLSWLSKSLHFFSGETFLFVKETDVSVWINENSVLSEVNGFDGYDKSYFDELRLARYNKAKISLLFPSQFVNEN